MEPLSRQQSTQVWSSGEGFGRDTLQVDGLCVDWDVAVSHIEEAESSGYGDNNARGQRGGPDWKTGPLQHLRGIGEHHKDR